MALSLPNRGGELKRRGRESGWSSIEAGYEVQEETAELIAALPRLSPKQRASIVLHYECGYSLKEIAEIIGPRTRTSTSWMPTVRTSSASPRTAHTRSSPLGRPMAA
jgi:DNA-directed RNA polymerase specialized sigma24 family protein